MHILIHPSCFPGQLKKDKSGESNCSNCCVIVWHLILHHLILFLSKRWGRGMGSDSAPTWSFSPAGLFSVERTLASTYWLFTKASLWYQYRGILGGFSGNIYGHFFFNVMNLQGRKKGGFWLITNICKFFIRLKFSCVLLKKNSGNSSYPVIHCTFNPYFIFCAFLQVLIMHSVRICESFTN